jgi:hypothetical protein
MNEPEIACGGFVAAGCQASCAFEFAGAALDVVAERVNESVDLDGLFAVGPAWDGRLSPPFSAGCLMVGPDDG